MLNKLCNRLINRSPIINKFHKHYVLQECLIYYELQIWYISNDNKNNDCLDEITLGK